VVESRCQNVASAHRREPLRRPMRQSAKKLRACERKSASPKVTRKSNLMAKFGSFLEDWERLSMGCGSSAYRLRMTPNVSRRFGRKHPEKIRKPRFCPSVESTVENDISGVRGSVRSDPRKNWRIRPISTAATWAGSREENEISQSSSSVPLPVF